MNNLIHVFKIKFHITFEMITTSDQGLFRMYLVARNSALLHANNKGADQPAHPR